MMEEKPIDKNLDATPPYFKSWKPVYWIVIANIVTIIMILKLFFSTK